jgi:acetylornithine deacetylase/succinyl-diaminopimelate desuccinylase-like protein
MTTTTLRGSRWVVLAALTAAAACGPATDGEGASPAGGQAAQATPQATLPLDPLAAVDADSVALLADLRDLSSDSMEGRRPETPGSLRARDLIARRLRGAGLEPRLQAFTWPARSEGDPGQGVNVIASVRGTSRPEDWIVVTAHYDHVGVRDGEIYNGADDNASGTAALLFLARYLAEHPLGHSVILAALDAEEVGSQGAGALVADPPVPIESIRLNVNLDMVARTGGVLWAAGAYHEPGLRPILEEVAARSPVELRLGHDEPGVAGVEDWSGSSDHRAFHAVGIPFVYFGVEDHPDYHRPSDDFERVDVREYLDAVRTVTLALRALDRAF